MTNPAHPAPGAADATEETRQTEAELFAEAASFCSPNQDPTLVRFAMRCIEYGRLKGIGTLVAERDAAKVDVNNLARAIFATQNIHSKQMGERYAAEKVLRAQLSAAAEAERRLREALELMKRRVELTKLISRTMHKAFHEPESEEGVECAEASAEAKGIDAAVGAALAGAAGRDGAVDRPSVKLSHQEAACRHGKT
jgi:hypothetical protein